MACGLKSLSLADSEVITVRMPQVWKCRLAQSESCIKIPSNVKVVDCKHSYRIFLIHETDILSGFLNTLASGCFRGFSGKKRLNAHGFTWEFIRSGMLYRPGKSLKRRGKSSSLHSKKIFCLGVRLFFERRHKWRTFRPPWPILPGPGHQPLGGSISLKFLLETRL